MSWLRHLMRSTLLRVVGKPLAGLLLLSLCWAIVVALPHLSLDLRGNRQLFALAMGFAVGMVIVAAGLHPRAIYVTGHELTHWLVAKLFGRRTSRLRIGLQQGSVMVEDPNIWIVLAPYFVPFWSVVWIIAGLLLHLVWQPAWYGLLYHGGIGLTFAHHLVLSALMIAVGQKDLLFHGTLFSLVVIVAGNLVVLFIALAILSGAPLQAFAHLAVGFAQQADLLVILWQRVRPG